MDSEVVIQEFNGTTVRPASELNIHLTVVGLRPGEHVVLQHDGEQGKIDTHYVQARLRPEGGYQLEYRSGSAAKHFQTLTDSRDDVVAALSGWAKGDFSWRDKFEWKSIGEWFTRQ
jgi:5-hydroxyisourate hydrolase-like protein (transthyretin family)